MIPQTTNPQAHPQYQYFSSNYLIKESKKQSYFTSQLKVHLSNIYDKHYNNNFDNKFERVLTEYICDDPKTIKNFISNNQNLLEVLIHSKSKLDFYFKDCHFILKIFKDSEDDHEKLGLIIQVDPNTLSSKIAVDNLLKFNSYIRPLKRKLGLIDNFFVDVEYL